VIETSRVTLARAELGSIDQLPLALEQRANRSLLRWYVADATPDRLTIELTTTSASLQAVEPVPVQPDGTSVVVSLVPTGVGCNVGGFAGDAGPSTQLLAACTDYLVTNPNAVNASDVIALPDNVVYTEGSIVDLFCGGNATLGVPYGNRVGVVLERSGIAETRHAIAVVDAAHSVHGVDIVDVAVTKRSVGTRSVRMASGAYSGTVDDPDELLSACETLVAQGATALALATLVRDVDSAKYRAHLLGRHPNPLGGAEAVLSHLVTRTTGIPAAHAPLVNVREPAPAGGVDARSAGEAISISGLLSVLVGLRRAPQFRHPFRGGIRQSLGRESVAALVAPASALGGPAVIGAYGAGIPIVAVAEPTILSVSADALGLDGVVGVRNYVEAAGAVVALQLGISRESLVRPLRSRGALPIEAEGDRDGAPAERQADSAPDLVADLRSTGR
jgi:hypothetical protein